MVYRKSEQPVPRVVRTEVPRVIARAMSEGDRWFYAWTMQECTGGGTLQKRTGIPMARIREIADGSTFTRTELAALASAWWVTPDALLASMPDPTIVVG